MVRSGGFDLGDLGDFSGWILSRRPKKGNGHFFFDPGNLNGFYFWDFWGFLDTSCVFLFF